MSHGHDTHLGHHTKQDYEHALVEHDSWFRHDATEPHHKEAHGSTKPMIIVVFLAATVVLVGVTAVLCIELLLAMTRTEHREKQEANEQFVAEIRESKAGWNAKLATYEWVDPQAGAVRVPLNQAKQMVIAEYAKKPGAGN